MALRLVALAFDALDPERVAGFWAGLLGWRVSDEGGSRFEVTPGDDVGFGLRFVPADRPKAGPNRIHLDLISASDDAQRARVDAAIALGGARLDLGLGPGERHQPMVDPEGNELCVIEADNRFLAACAPPGAINCEGTRAVGHFWSLALGWPLVWDQDEETAIQSPRDGTTITWSGPPVPPQDGVVRQHLVLAPDSGTTRVEEVRRLVRLGAVPVDDTGLGLARWGSDVVALRDPDGNELQLIRPGS